MGYLTKAVKCLLGLIFCVFIVQQTADQFFGMHLFSQFSLHAGADFCFWQPFTYVFLHQNVTQLFFNLFAFGFIGSSLESIWGVKRFLIYCFFCSITTTGSYFLLQFLMPSRDFMLFGFAPIIYGLLTAYGILFSHRTLLFMLMFPIPARLFVLILAFMEFLSGVYSHSPYSFIQLSAMGFGYIGLLWMAYYEKARRHFLVSRKARPNLRLVVNKDKKGPPSSKKWH